MAITKIHPIKSTVQKAVNYICNPDKTDGALLIDSFACDYHMAEAEFRIPLSKGTGQGENLAFHLIQSYAPGEVDADTAHEIGEKLAERLLKGNHSYVVSTHIDKNSVHNHIIFCAADNFTYRKYYDNKQNYWKIRNLSDQLCREYGLSVIEEHSKSKGLSYEEWMAQGEGRSWKTQLKDDIRKCIKEALTYDDFIMLMKDLGYEIKGEKLLSSVRDPSVLSEDIAGNDTKTGENAAKYISFRAPGQPHFIRGSVRGLGRNFTEESIADAIEKQSKIREARSTIPVKKMEYLLKKTAPYNSLIDRSSEKFRDSPWLNRWADKKELQSAAHAFAEAGDTVQLQRKIDDEKKKASELKASIAETEKKIETFKELSVYVKNYRQYKKVAEAYKKAKDKEKFYEEHESQIMIFDAAKSEIMTKGLDPAKITYEQVLEGIDKLTERKKTAQAEYRTLSKDIRDKEQQLQMMNDYMDREGIKTLNPRFLNEKLNLNFDN